MARWSCTQKGYVHYKRKPHPFTYTDVYRVLNKIDGPHVWQFEERILLLKVLALCLEKLSFLPWRPGLFSSQEDVGILGRVFTSLEHFVSGLSERTISAD